MARKTKMNKLTSPELLKQVNPVNTELRDEFLNYLKAIQRSEGTIKQYRNDLDIFFCWVLQHARNKDFTKVTKRDLIAFQGWLINDNGNSPARVRRIKSAVSSMSNFCENILADEDEQYESFRSIVRKIESPALEPVREKTVWETETLEKLLRELSESGDAEKACFLALAMYSGRRKAELCRFRVSDFDDERLVCDGALYKSAPLKTKGRGGGKMIPCYTLAKKFRPYLDAWMAKREEEKIESDWLFPDRTDPAKHIPISTPNSWADTLSKMSGENFYFHSLRHFFTTSLSKAGIPDGVIQTIVNWDSADMVRLYKDIDAEDEIGMYFKNGEIVAPEQKALGDL